MATLDKSKPKKAKLSYKPLAKKIVISFCLVAIGFFINASFVQYNYNPKIGLSNRANRPNMSEFWNVYDLLQKKYYGNINTDNLVEGAITGEVASLNDPYTVYLSAKEAQNLRDELSGSLSGIGVEIGIKNNKLTVIAPIDGTPASAAGIRSGDVIAGIDGVDASTYSLDEAVAKIRGTKDTKVKLTIAQGTTRKDVEITRAQITVDSVKSEIRPDGVGVIKIRDFGDNTTDRVAQVAQQLKDAHVKGIVLDLRDNPGGYLQSAVDVVSEFQKDGLVVEERGKEKSVDKSYYATGRAKLDTVPLVILINSGTASAAEITAGSLHDVRSITLVGEKSYGKGVVQEIIDLGGGKQLKVTIAKWYTPKGTNISKEGIKPDVEVKNTEADFNAGADPQFNKALEVLTSKM